MRLADLAFIVLEDERPRSVEHADRSADDRRRVASGRHALPAGLDAPQLHRRVLEEGRPDADRVRAAADAGEDDVGEAPAAFEALASGLATDDRLEVLHHRRIRVGPDAR